MADKPVITQVTGQADNNSFQVNTATDELAEAISKNLERDGSDFMVGDLNMNSNQINNLAPPTALTDAARLADIPDGTESGGVTQLRLDLANGADGYGIDLVANGIKEIDNIAALRAGAVNTETVYVLGYYTAGDGGGGQFYWDSASTETDNSGTIIKVTSVTIGRWKRQYDTIYASFFGYNSSQTDVTNAAAVQAALDFTTPGTVIIPSGACSFTSVTMPQNTELIFEKDAIFVGTTDANIITINKNTRLINPQIDASGISGFSHACIYLYGSPTLPSRNHNTQIVNPWLWGSSVQEGYGIHFDASGADGLKISFVGVYGGHINLFDKAIFLEDDPVFNGYVTACIFTGQFLSGNDYNLHIEHSNGNIFDNIEIQPTTTLTRQIYCSGSFNTFDNIFFWDVTNPTAIELTSDSSKNIVKNVSGSGPRGLIDLGEKNSVNFAYGGLSVEKEPRVTGNENYSTKTDNILLYAHKDYTVTQTSGSAPTVGVIDNMFIPGQSVRWNNTSTFPVVVEVDFGPPQQNIVGIGAKFTELYHPDDLKFEVYNTVSTSWIEWFSNTENSTDYVFSTEFFGVSGTANNVGKVRITLNGVNTTTNEIRAEDFIMLQRYDKSEGKKYLSKLGGNVYGSVGAESGFRTGNSVVVGTIGSITHKMEIFDMNGVSLGFIPIYN